MDVTALEIFLDVVRQGSFASVARSRDLDPSVVSRTIAGLEEEVGGRLFQRTTRRLSLTEAGSVFFDRVGPAIDELSRARDGVAETSGEARGTLRVTTSVSFGERRLVPLLPGFMAANPRLSVTLMLTESVIDLVGERIDVAIRLGQLADSGLVARRLVKTSYVLCASPSYLDAHPPILKPDDIKNHECLLFAIPAFRERWIFRDRRGRTEAIPVRGRLKVSTGSALHQCVVAGMGITLLPHWMVAGEIASEALRHVLPHYDVTVSDFETGIWMVYPTRAQVPLKVRVFGEFLSRALRRGRT